MSMSQKETRSTWLIRALNAKQSYLFHVDVVIEEDEPGLFSAYVVGMEDTMAASGADIDEATENAKLLFMATVDDALDGETSVSFAIGTSDHQLLNIPISQAHEVFDALENAETEDDDAEWFRIPAHVAHAHSATER